MRRQSREAWDALTPQSRAALDAATPHHEDRLWLAGILGNVPQRYHARVIRGYAENLAAHGQRRANLAMLDLGAKLKGPVPLNATEQEIREAGRKCAEAAARILTRTHDEAAARRALMGLFERYRINPPNFEDFTKFVNRATEPAWWRRKLRRQFQKAEGVFINMGFVHARAALYISDEGYARFESHRRSTARMMEQQDVISKDTGLVLGTLSEVAEHSLSNPRVRRADLMTRLAGVEQYAKGRGYTGLFITITCPGRMHARHSSTGDRNEKYDGTTPRRAQGYLQGKVWAPARKALEDAGINSSYFGFRVVEPHHDGTPHWHLLVFVKPDREAELLDILRRYAMRVDHDEDGADKHRFQVERIDSGKGSAVAYVAKYVSKNLDGHGVGADLENGQDAAHTAPRAVAWARQWGIRTFDFFGLDQKATVYRETRCVGSLSPVLDALIGPVWRAADEGKFGDFLELQADPAGRLGLLVQEVDSSRYRGEKTRRVVGLHIPVADGAPVELLTHTERWEIRFRGGRDDAKNGWSSTPWTRVNKCGNEDSYGFQGTLQEEKSDMGEVVKFTRGPPLSNPDFYSDEERAGYEFYVRNGRWPLVNECLENWPDVFGVGGQKKERPPTGLYPMRRPSNSDSTLGG